MTTIGSETDRVATDRSAEIVQPQRGGTAPLGGGAVAVGLAPAMRNDLSGMRVLVVEDIWIVAQSYVSMLENLGVIVSGPVGTVADAMRLIELAPVDAALVDLNLQGEMADGVVEALTERGVVVAVITGYGDKPELEQKVSAFLRKPVRAEVLIKTLRSIVPAS